MSLERLGWDQHWSELFAPYSAHGLIPARVTVQHNHLYLVRTDTRELQAWVAGKLRHRSVSPAELPAVGDWVAIRLADDRSAVIDAVLGRRGAFARRAAGPGAREQVIATNVDVGFIVMSLDHDFSLRRLERYLARAWESGATPVVLLNKADLCDNAGEYAMQAGTVAIGADVHTVSARQAETLAPIRRHLAVGRTAVFVGSSGVGKSTLINALLGEEKLRTTPVRLEDSKGRHTTSHRQLLLLPTGGVVIDTPGMRELQLWLDSGGLDSTFSEIEELAASCRFGDCRHLEEPECAVRDAIAPDRLASFHKLQREAAHLAREADPLLRATEKKRWKALTKAAEKRGKEKRS